MKKGLYNTNNKIWMSEEDDDYNEMKLAHSYVQWQSYDKAFSPCEALMKGTFFPKLYGVYKIPK